MEQTSTDFQPPEIKTRIFKSKPILIFWFKIRQRSLIVDSFLEKTEIQSFQVENKTFDKEIKDFSMEKLKTFNFFMEVFFFPTWLHKTFT